MNAFLRRPLTIAVAKNALFVGLCVIGAVSLAAMLLQRYTVRLPVGGAVGAPRFQVTLRPEGTSALWLQRREAPQGR